MLKKFYDSHFKRKAFYKKHSTLYTIISLGSILFWVFTFKSSVLDANNIPSGSMEPTLKIGDFLFVNKMRYALDIPFTDIRLWHFSEPQRGDIVTFTPAANAADVLQGKTLVKRVVGVPGDIVQVYDHEIIVNGQRYETELQADRSVMRDLGYREAEMGDLQLYREKITDPGTGELKVAHYIMKYPKMPGRRGLFSRLLRNSVTRAIRAALKPVYNRAFSSLVQHYHTSGRRLPDFSGMQYPKRTWVIPAGYYMVVGDNRGRSDDSRGCNMIAGHLARRDCELRRYGTGSEAWGLVPIERIHGKVLLAYFSVNWGPEALDRAARSNSDMNPLWNLLDFIKGRYPNAHVRWDRVFRRIY